MYSHRVLKYVQEVETFLARAEHLPADAEGVLTVGYGETVGVHSGSTRTIFQAMTNLSTNLLNCSEAVLNLVHVPITQGQLDSLVDFAFNEGAHALATSTLLRLLNEKDYLRSAEEFARWDIAGGRHRAGLRIRRALERAWFLEPGPFLV